MYNNRQNNRFSKFIGAIVVSLLVLITGCSSTQKGTNSAKPITEDSFRCFREAYLIGGAHPNEQLYSIQHFLQNNFMNMNYARLEAASILVVLFVGAFVLIGMYLAKKRNNR